MLNFKALGMCWLFGTTLAVAQTAAPQAVTPSFEVASIRPSAATPTAGVGGVRITKGQFHSSYMSLKDYVAVAYNVKLYQISGPDWMSSTRFDISATMPETATPENAPLPEMLQGLLAKRFGIQIHREKKDLPVYVLEVAKGGLKMEPAPPLPGDEAGAPFEVTGGGNAQGVSVTLGRGSSMTFGNGRFDGVRLDMATLAGTLERFLDRPVIDMTSLQDRYTFGFPVTAEDYRAMMVRAAVSAGVPLPPEALRLLDANSPVGIFDELRKLGINVVARSSPLDLVVVDKLEKTPTEN